MKKNADSLNLIEIFASVQGESSLTGWPTTFIRLAACNLRCSWCDTSYSFGRGSPFSLQAIKEQVHELGCRYVCMTGGEPLLQQNVYPLMTDLCNEGFLLSLETGGSLSTQQVDPRVKVILDIKCPGSGMSEKNHWENLNRLRQNDEVKFVLLDRKDYDWAVAICHSYGLFELGCSLLFSPVFDKLHPQQLVQWILQDKLLVRLNLQVHKFIWSPETRGV